MPQPNRVEILTTQEMRSCTKYVGPSWLSSLVWVGRPTFWSYGVGPLSREDAARTRISGQHRLWMGIATIWLFFGLGRLGLAQNGTAHTATPLTSVTATATPASAANPDIAIPPPAAQARISAVMGRDQAAYHVHIQPADLCMENPRNGFAAEFSASGVGFAIGANRWTLALVGYGYGQKLHPVLAVAPKAEANRVEYRRGIMTEWYVNGPEGIEQGFTLERPPEKSHNQPLILTFGLSGDLSATVDRDGRGLTLRKNGAIVLRYAGLLVRDADERNLHAWLETDRDRLRLQVDDRHARFPVTIDPLIQTAKLTASDGVGGDALAYSVSLSADGNTMAVGAPNAPIDFKGTQGAVYIFTKAASQSWTTTSTFAAKLTASDGSAGDALGLAVSISGDGRTVAAANGTGKAYIWLEPLPSWTNAALPLHETNLIIGGSGFGSDLSLSGDGSALAVGAAFVQIGSNVNQGEVEVFVSGDNWISFSTAQLTRSNGFLSGNELGRSVRISSDGTTIVAGAPGFNPQGEHIGAVCVFVKPAAGWGTSTEAAIFAVFTDQEDATGSSVGISNDGSVVVAGAPANVFPGGRPGSVRVYVKPTTGWASAGDFPPVGPAAFLFSSDKQLGDQLGYSVSVSGDGSTVVAGAVGETVNSNAQQGAIYVFAQPASGWTSQTEAVRLTASDGAAGDVLGVAVSAIAKRSLDLARPPTLTIVAGAPFATIGQNTAQGAAYVFTGTALSPLPALSLSSIAFTSAAGMTSGAQQVTLTNSGTAPLEINSVVASGPFMTTQNCVAASPLAPNGSCTEDVTLSASPAGTFTGALTFTDDANVQDGSTQQVALSATVKQASTITTVSSLSPDPALVGEAVTASFSVAPPSGDTLAPSGTVTVNASTGESCTGAAPSGSCSLTFASALTRAITASYGGDANFTTSTSAGASEQVVDFSLSASPSSEAIPPGHLASYMLTITSLNGFAGTVSLACGPQPPHSTCTISPNLLSLSNSTGTANVTINIENKGTYTFSFIASDGSLSHTASVQLAVK